MDASDIINRNKAKAQWVNYLATVQTWTQGCVTGGCTSTLSTPCIVRYNTFEERDTIRIGRDACTSCSTIACYYKSTA
jgi:hypothetical protein